MSAEKSVLGAGERLNHPRVALFLKNYNAGRVDLDSGAWERVTNARACHCGRCAEPIAKGEGRPYNVFMRDHYRATTHYLCSLCVVEIRDGLSSDTGANK